MSPSRTRKPVARIRPRHELIMAIAIGAGIVIGTVLLVWLIRPGEAGVPGSGGLLSRQPRVTLLVIGTALVLGGVLWWLRHGRHRPRNVSLRVATIVAVVVIVGGAVVLGVLWPGGLVRHYPSLVQVPDTPDDLPAPDTAPPTSAPAATTPPTAGGG